MAVRVAASNAVPVGLSGELSTSSRAPARAGASMAAVGRKAWSLPHWIGTAVAPASSQ